MDKSGFSAEDLALFNEAFAAFDADNDGKISKTELQHVMQQLGMDPNEDELKKIISEFDADGNGALEFSEFLKMMKSELNSE